MQKNTCFVTLVAVTSVTGLHLQVGNYRVLYFLKHWLQVGLEYHSPRFTVETAKLTLLPDIAAQFYAKLDVVKTGLSCDF